MTLLMDDPEELLDLVNDQDEVIGTIRREEIPTLEQTGKGYTRAVGVFLINNEGKLWVPRRQQHKKIAPGGLDFSSAEHVDNGETYVAAVLRGLKEELNINADQRKLKSIGIVKPFTSVPYFHPVYTYRYDIVPDFSKDDYSGFEWLTPAEVEQKLQDGEPAKEVLLPALHLLIGDNK